MQQASLPLIFTLIMPATLYVVGMLSRTHGHAHMHTHAHTRTANQPKHELLAIEGARVRIRLCYRLEIWASSFSLHSGKINVKISGSERGAGSEHVVRQVVSMHVIMWRRSTCGTRNEVKGSAQRDKLTKAGENINMFVDA